MIAKMKFFKITGPVAEFDRVISDYISRYEIQIENAVAELKDLERLRHHNDINPYNDILHKAEMCMGLVEGHETSEPMTISEAESVINDFDNSISNLESEKKELINELEHKKELLADIIPFSQIHYDLSDILHFKYIKYRFGKIAKEYYKKLEDFLHEDMCSIFYKCQSDSKYVWGVYFVPASESEKVDSIYSSMHFERYRISDEYEGSVEQAIEHLTVRVDELEKKLGEIDEALNNLKTSYAGRVLKAYSCIKQVSKNYDIRKQIAYIGSEEGESFVLCGWMQENDAISLKKEISGDINVYMLFEDDHEGPFGGAPIKLENPKILKPFEMLIKMYGLPDYKEFDPTWFVAISYTFLFGVMFGDVGQGLCLALGGFLLYKIKKMNLAAIISVAGIFSAIFGLVFGSIFGYEDIIEPLWIRPTEHMSDLPFIGRLNTVFAMAIVIGMCLILIMMVFNIVNAIKSGNFSEAIFDHNGVCGLIFYGSVVACVLLFMTGNALPGGIVLGVMFGVPLVLIILKEPLMAIVFKHTDKMPKEKGMFIVQAFFEIFEVLLSYFSNTLSFVRIGGFVVSHASMMAVVLMLAGAEHGGSAGNILVIILGNIIVCGLEGLIVGIQVMRLEYYEMFSRFYKGGGREFKPYSEN